MILLSIFKFSHTPLASIRRSSSRNTTWILLINTFVYHTFKKIFQYFQIHIFILILLPRINPSKVSHEYIERYVHIRISMRDRSSKRSSFCSEEKCRWVQTNEKTKSRSINGGRTKKAECRPLGLRRTMVSRY